MMALPLILAPLVMMPFVFPGIANAHGPPPGGCAMYHGIEYQSEITSFIVDNGEQQYDVLADSGVIIPVTRDQQFSVEFTLNADAPGFRMENGSRVEVNSSDEDGYAWYRDFANGYPFSKCAGPMQGDTDFEIAQEYPVSHMFQGEGPHPVYFETTLDDSRPKAQFYLQIVDDVTETEVEELDETVEDRPDDDPVGDEGNPALDPFLSQPDLTETTSDESENVGDLLTINGTIASLSPPVTTNTTADSSQGPLIIAGDWVMSVNNTAVSDFRANITIVSADGQSREDYQIANFTSVDSSAVEFDSNLITLASASSIVSDEGQEVVNIVITLERLNAMRIDLDGSIDGNVTGPIYGVVDKLVISDNGEQAQVIAR